MSAQQQMPGLQQLLRLIASFYSWHQELVSGIFDAQCGMPMPTCVQWRIHQTDALVLNKIDEWRMIVYVNGRH